MSLTNWRLKFHYLPLFLCAPLIFAILGSLLVFVSELAVWLSSLTYSDSWHICQRLFFFFFFYSPAEVYLSQMLVDLFETAGISITQATLLWRLQIRGRQGQIITPPAQECLCVLVEKTFDSFLCSDMLQCTPNTIYTFNKGLGCKTPSDFILPNL